MRKIFLIPLLLSSFLFGKSEFIKICENPTPEQKTTLNRVFHWQFTEYNSNRCEELEQIYIKNPDRKIKNLTLQSKDEDNEIISDIDVLKYFNLESLLLGEGNNIKDISPLKNLKNLKKLDITYNPIDNIDVLSNLTNLEKLSLDQNSLKDLKPLRNLKNLKNLNILRNNANEYLDISVLAELKNLKRLFFTIEPKDICVLNSLTQLEELIIQNKKITNISCLDKLKNISYLKLSVNSIENIDVLKNYKKLKILKIEDTQIKNLDALKDLENLHTVYVKRNSKLEDTSAISYKELGNYEAYDNPKLKWCSPKTYNDMINHKSCYEKDGTLKPLWKRVLGI
ncbi:leucine-rich repeat domain-containing protein [Aliarcobacter skirrowii]|uniref:leucine-rich repeat domain-containing protein n=1 Tax=Aliarcobacter skirrowii TaxID=28200 RepID=UPI0029A6537A|nr:leucine-rich repeat domain-containing protein [Aliarcobacter skirrowii]MDX4036240.1 leucine-rich repeat domain-containing protein [Aliarcobacter skirrowii]